MRRKPRVDRFREEKRQTVQGGIKSEDVLETCRRHGIAPNLFYWCSDPRNRAMYSCPPGHRLAVAILVP